MEEYTNRELGLLMKNITEKIDDGFKGVHERQDTTNGNVMRNRTDIDELKYWRWYMMGGLTLIGFLIVVAIKFL